LHHFVICRGCSLQAPVQLFFTFSLDCMINLNRISYKWNYNHATDEPVKKPNELFILINFKNNDDYSVCDDKRKMLMTMTLKGRHFFN